MFYNHARFILTMIGILMGLTGYCLGRICQVGNERILWIGPTLIFTFGGFLIGGLIQKLSIRSHIDYLTGLWNRRYFCLKLKEEAVRKMRARKQLCVAMIDVDGFKNINDSYGHAVGDTLLSHIAVILKEIPVAKMSLVVGVVMNL